MGTPATAPSTPNAAPRSAIGPFVATGVALAVFWFELLHGGWLVMDGERVVGFHAWKLIVLFVAVIVCGGCGVFLRRGERNRAGTALLVLATVHAAIAALQVVALIWLLANHIG